MRVCSFCGENNEDWMNICQRCGNSIVNGDIRENERKKEPYQINEVKYTSKKQKKTENKFIDIEETEPKGKRIIQNLDLKIILIILLIILLCLIAYTISTL